MPVIASGNGFSISTSFGHEVVEGSVSSGVEGAGRLLTFRFEQSPVNLRTVFVQIVPLSGNTGDFWDNFWSNNINGEPADQFALSMFVNVQPSGTFSVLLNADNYDEGDETFACRIFESNLDAALGYAPLLTANFTILDDDIFGTPGRDNLIGRNFAETLRGYQGNDKLAGGGGNDTLFGDQGDDTLKGGLGNDTLLGGDGSDKLIGGKGKDILTGGIGADRFVFKDGDTKNVISRRDVVTDFERGNDKLDLRLIDADLGMRGDQSFEFSGTSAAANSVWYTASQDGVIVMGDNTGDGHADFKITLLNVVSLESDDFLL